MSEFLFVIPEGWIEVDWATASAANPQLNPVNIEAWSAQGRLDYISDALVAQNMLQPGDVIIDAKLFNGEVFAIKLG